jgi:hypothetical protein
MSRSHHGDRFGEQLIEALAFLSWVGDAPAVNAPAVKDDDVYSARPPALAIAWAQGRA